MVDRLVAIVVLVDDDDKQNKNMCVLFMMMKPRLKCYSGLFTITLS